MYSAYISQVSLVKDDRSVRNRALPVGDNGWSETPNSGLLVARLKHLRDTNMSMSDKIRRDF